MNLIPPKLQPYIIRSSFFFLMILLMCFVWPSTSLAYMEKPSELPPISGHLSFFEEEEGELTLSEILTPQFQSKFHALAGSSINPGYTRKGYWLKLNLPGPEVFSGVLSLSPNFLDVLDVYVRKEGSAGGPEDFEHYAFGDHRPLPIDGISEIVPSVKLGFKAGGEKTIYIRLLNEGTFTQLHLRLDAENELPLRRLSSSLVIGVWFGAMIALLLMQLVFFLFDRRPRHLLLAASTLGVVLVYVGNLGLSRIYLFPNSGDWNDAFIGVNAWAGFSASAFAYASILSLWRKSKTLYALYVCFAIVGFIGVGFAIAGKNIVSGQYMSLTAIIAALTTMVLGWRYVNHDGHASRLSALAFTLVACGGLLAMVQRLGVSWMPEWVFNLYGISAMLQTLLLTGAVGVRLRDAENMNRALQQDALNQSQIAERNAKALVEERTRELVEARRLAEDALKAETESQLRQVRFLEVVSHQYRTPLASIRSNIDGVAFFISKQDEANLSRIARIRRAVARLSETLEINVARSRLQGASFRASMKTIRAGDIANAAFQRAHDLLNAPDLMLTVETGADSVELLADADMLELAIVNLLENSVKYGGTNDGEKIVLSLKRTANELWIGVEDKGLGIPETDIEHIFENATRGSNTSNIEGSGLGLFLVSKVAVAHSGRVEVSSREGQGSLFRIILPVGDNTTKI